MDCIADYSGDAIGISRRMIDQDAMIGRVRMRLLVTPSSVRVDLNEIGLPRLKLVDVLIGPLDL
jgi:hypothetical protein